jgi:hypothetical protein
MAVSGWPGRFPIGGRRLSPPVDVSQTRTAMQQIVEVRSHREPEPRGGGHGNKRLQTFPGPPCLFVQQDISKLLEARWRIFQRSDDRLPLGNRQSEHLGAVEKCGIQPAREGWRKKSSELLEKSLVDSHATHQQSLVPLDRSSESLPLSLGGPSVLGTANSNRCRRSNLANPLAEHIARLFRTAPRQAPPLHTRSDPFFVCPSVTLERSSA